MSIIDQTKRGGGQKGEVSQRVNFQRLEGSRGKDEPGSGLAPEGIAISDLTGKADLGEVTPDHRGA